MRKWAVNFFDGVNEVFRCVYAGCVSGFLVVDELNDEDDTDCYVLYRGKDREKVVSLMEETGNVTQAVIDMIRAFPINK